MTTPDSNNTPVEGYYKTLTASLTNHPDLYDLVKVFGYADLITEPDADTILLASTTASPKLFKFVRNDVGYQMTVLFPE